MRAWSGAELRETSAERVVPLKMAQIGPIFRAN